MRETVGVPTANRDRERSRWEAWMPRDLGQNNENRQPDDWDRIDSEFQQRAGLQRKWDAEHDPGSEFERSARPLGPDYGADRPRHREIPPEVAAEFGRTPEELQRLRERDPRGAGRHAEMSSDDGPSDYSIERGGRTPETGRHDPPHHDEPGRVGRSHLGELPRAEPSTRHDVPGRSGAHVRLGEVSPSADVRDIGARRIGDAPRHASSRHDAPRHGRQDGWSHDRAWTDRAGNDRPWATRALGNLEQRGPHDSPTTSWPAKHLGTYQRADSYQHEGGQRIALAERGGPTEHGGLAERGGPAVRGGLGERLGLDQGPPGRRESARHVREGSQAEELATDSRELEGSPDVPAPEDARPERAYPPSWLSSADRPPPVEQTRTYNEVGHLAEPLPSEQRALEEVIPRDEQGNFERFSDPRQDWAAEVNGVGPILEPGRGSNCLDCTLSAISTWHGEPRVSAPRHAEYDPNGDPVRTGEREGPTRAERWLGQDFEMVDQDAASAFPEIERRMLDAGHGSSAVIVNGWAPGGAHAWNAFNYEGEVYWVDTQLGDVSDRPLYPQAVDVRAIMMDSEGNKA